MEERLVDPEEHRLRMQELETFLRSYGLQVAVRLLDATLETVYCLKYRDMPEYLTPFFMDLDQLFAHVLANQDLIRNAAQRRGSLPSNDSTEQLCDG